MVVNPPALVPAGSRPRRGSFEIVLIAGGPDGAPDEPLWSGFAIKKPPRKAKFIDHDKAIALVQAALS